MSERPRVVNCTTTVSTYEGTVQLEWSLSNGSTLLAAGDDLKHAEANMRKAYDMAYPLDGPAQNPMQPQIQGYRKFDQATSDYINGVKDAGKGVQALLEQAEQLGASPRELALARTHFQQGAMWLIRSVAKPEGLF